MHTALRGAAATAVALAAFAVTTPSAAAKPAEEHCVVRVTGVSPSGELTTTAPDCGSDRDAVMAAEMMSTAGADFTIGVHYDGLGLTGSSFSVVGDSCIGGFLNLSASWDNRVSSTSNGCPRIRHFDGSNLTGASQSTFSPGGNLSTLNNKANSIQYLSS